MTVPSSPNQIKNARKQESVTDQIQFPETLGNVGTLLLFKKYSYIERETGPAGGIKTVKSADAKIIDSIYLPIPEQLLDSTSLKLAGTELGSGGNVLAKSMQKLTAGSLEEIARGVQKSLKEANTDKILSTVVAKAAKSLLTAVGLQSAQGGIEAGVGATFNPYAALTFEGVDIKTYTWNWILSPRTTGETTILRKIINKLKKNSLPYYKAINGAGGRAFLGYPNVCIPIITGVDTLIMKPTMISNISVDYAGAGEVVFLEGGNPAVVKIEITLQEMQIWTREDYDGTKIPDATSSFPSGFEGM